MRLSSATWLSLTFVSASCAKLSVSSDVVCSTKDDCFPNETCCRGLCIKTACDTPTSDAGPDAGDGGGTDASVDSGAEAGFDGGPDVGGDAGDGGGADASSESDGGLDGGLDAGLGVAISFGAAGQNVAESVGTVTVTANLSDASAVAVYVPYTVSGSAAYPGDHNLTNGLITIPPGLATSDIVLAVVNDSLYEIDEEIVVTLGSPINAALGSPAVHTVTILNDDVQPTVAFVDAGQTVTEAVGAVTVSVGLSAPSGRAVTVPYTVSGTAAYPGDHNLTSGAVSLDAGATSADVVFAVVNDTMDEPSETVVVTLGTPTNATLGATTVHTVTVLDDDSPPSVSFVAASQLVPEWVGDASVEVVLSGASAFDVTVPFSVSGTATKPADHTVDGGSITIPAGETSALIPLGVVNDGVDENHETISLLLGTPTNASLGATSTHVATIADDEGAVVEIAAGRYHVCAVLANGKVRCWGWRNASGGIGDITSGLNSFDISVGGDVVHLAAGYQHTCALLGSGTVRCWGRAVDGVLGYAVCGSVFAGTFCDGVEQIPSTVGDVNVGGAVIQLAAGYYHTCALLSTGRVRCWGRAGSGQLGYGNTVNIGVDAGQVPATAGDVDVGGIAVQVAAGNDHTCARLATGRVRCWGGNAYGQLGYGHTESIGDDAGETPATAGDIDLGGAALSIAAGTNHTCAVLANGRVRCWGANGSGQLGYGNVYNIGDNGGEFPSGVGDVDVGADVVQIALGGAHTCVLQSNGAVRCWGWGLYGQLGYGGATNVGDDAGEFPSTAGLVSVGGHVVQIVAGADFTCARLATGKVRCWGLGAAYALGNGSTANIGDDPGEFPSTVGYTLVGGDGGVVEVAACSAHTCARSQNGRAYCWGDNDAGQLGDGTGIRRPTPGAVGALGTITALALGDRHTCALVADGGAAACWGENAVGQLGDGTSISRATPVTVGGLQALTAIGGGNEHSCALRGDGTVWCWGRNEFGQVGDGTTSGRFAAVQVVGIAGARALAVGGEHACALVVADGGVPWCWGRNNVGQLGDGDGGAFRAEPVATGGVVAARALAAGKWHTCALLADGTVACWGRNADGQLGDGTMSDRWTPVPVVGLDAGETTGIWAGRHHTCVRTSSGGVKCWGRNSDGQVGDATTATPKTTPTAVPGLQSVKAVAGGGKHSCALLTDGTLRCWGNNGGGALGDGTYSDRWVPTPVMPLP